MIRKIITSDFPIVYKLGEEINENYSHVYNLTSIINDNNQIIYVYIINNAVVGFIHLTVSFDEADIVDIITDLPPPQPSTQHTAWLPSASAVLALFTKSN